MAISVSFNGVVYSIPQTGEESWGENLTSYFTAIPSGALQKSGGTFTLTADVNFGASFGLLSRYFSTRTALPSTAGLVRLALADTIGWRNNANSANLLLAVNGSDQLTFNGTAIFPGGITALTGDVTATGPGSVAATIANNAVTDAKFRTSGALSVVGRGSNTTGNVADISAGTDHFVLRRSGTALSFGLLLSANLDPAAAIAFSQLAALNSGNILVGNVSNVAASVAMSGDITISNSGVTAIGVNKVLDTMIRQGVALSVIGVTGNSTANVADIAAGTDHFVLRRSGTALSFGLLVNANLSGSAAISNANLAAMASSSTTVGTLKGNISGVSATPSDVVVSADNTALSVVLRDGSGNFAAGTITATLTGVASGNTTITPNQYGVVLSGAANALSVLAPDASTAKVLISGGASANPGWALITNTNLSGSAAISNANLATMLTATAKANISGSTATPSDVSLVAAATASTIMLRDTNANARLNALIENFATQATAASSTILTVSSAKIQQFTGVTTQICVLPDATTLVIGQQFFLMNRSSGIVTVNASGGGLVKAMAGDSQILLTVTDIGSAAGTWDFSYAANGSSTGTVTSVAMTVPSILSVAGSPVTTSGTLAVTLATQTANTVFAGPTSGGAVAPAFRALVGADIPTAIQSDQETGTSTTVFVSPGVQKFHPSASKAWVTYTSVTTTSILGSYGVTSLTDLGTGGTTVNLSTAFSSTNFATVTSSKDNGSAVGLLSFNENRTASTVNIYSINPSSLAAGDSAYVNVVCFGDQ